MVEGCDAIGEEPIVLLDDTCLSDVEAYGEYDMMMLLRGKISKKMREMN